MICRFQLRASYPSEGVDQLEGTFAKQTAALMAAVDANRHSDEGSVHYVWDIFAEQILATGGR